MVSTVPSLTRFVRGTAIPTEEGDLVCGTAAVRKGSVERMNAEEKYISDSARL
jgi:hypothetical protein